MKGTLISITDQFGFFYIYRSVSIPLSSLIPLLSRLESRIFPQSNHLSITIVQLS